MNGKNAPERRQLDPTDPMPAMVRYLAQSASQAYDAASEGDDVEGFIYAEPGWPDTYEITPDGAVFAHPGGPSTDRPDQEQTG